MMADDDRSEESEDAIQFHDAHPILFGAVMALLVAGFVLFILCAAEQVYLH